MGSFAPGNWLPALPDGKLLGPDRPTSTIAPDDLRDVRQGVALFDRPTTLFDYVASTRTFAISAISSPTPRGRRGSLQAAADHPSRTRLEGAQAQLPPGGPEAAAADISDPDQRADCVKDLTVTRRGLSRKPTCWRIGSGETTRRPRPC